MKINLKIHNKYSELKQGDILTIVKYFDVSDRQNLNKYNLKIGDKVTFDRYSAFRGGLQILEISSNWFSKETFGLS